MTHLKRIIATLGAMVACSLTAVAITLPDAKVKLQVREPDGSPVPDASLIISGDSASPRPDPTTTRRGMSGQDGVFEAQLKSRGEIRVSAEKTGYYRTEGVRLNYLDAANASELALDRGRWEPWNRSLEVVLKKVLNPVAMYARSINKGLPLSAVPIGFDLIVGDFVNPHGRGLVSDLVFERKMEERRADDYDLRITATFSNKQDGIIPFDIPPPLSGSVLRSPYQAPASGYLSEWTMWRSRRPSVGETSNYSPETHGCFIRVRTVLDDRGDIVSTNYGKIYGDFMNFTYYLNPNPNDRNVEFDTEKNLSENVKNADAVIAP